MHQLKFANQYVEGVQNGDKYITLRPRKAVDMMFAPDTAVELVDGDDIPFGVAVIGKRTHLTVRRAAEVTWHGHENYQSAQEVISALDEHYPELEMTSRTELLAYWFEYTGEP